jgi:capsid protein
MAEASPRLKRLGQRTDAAIAALFPGWGRDRYVARLQMDAMAKFAPLQHDRAVGPVPTGQGSLDERLPWWDRLQMISLFDSLVHENPLLCAMVDQYCCNVIPAAGIRPVPQTGNDVLDGELSRRFDDWAETAEVRGLSFWQFQRPWLKTLLGHGDNLTVRVADANGGRIQGLSANRLATPLSHGMYEGTQIHQGVYTGEGVTPRGWYVGRLTGSSTLVQDSFRYIPADFGLFGFDPARYDLDNYRGVSRFLAAFPHMRRAESILQYRAFQEKMAAVFGIAIKKSKEKATGPLSRLGSGNSLAETEGARQTTSTRPDIELFAGMGITLNNDEDIATIDPKSPGTDFETFFRLICRMVGISAGLPLEFVLLDWTRANYYGNQMSASMGRRQFLNTFMLVRALVRWTYLWQARRFIDEGLVKIPAGLDRDPLTHETTLPPPIEVDELKAFQLHRMKVESNVDTWESWCQHQGRVLTRIIGQRQTEIDKMKVAKLPILATSTPGVKLLSELEQGAKPTL